jgi:Cys-tRNA(Pro)/Cys-tRNA(Cys) deacylase
MAVNNVTRYLESKKVPYAVFELPAEKLGGEETARLLNAPPEIVFKSIVILRKVSGKPILAVVPGDREVDLKKLAKAVGEKKVTPASQREAEDITRLQAGGISPLALINRGFEIVVHDSLQESEEIHISGGERGINIRLASSDLINLTRAKIADIC